MKNKLFKILFLIIIILILIFITAYITYYFCNNSYTKKTKELEEKLSEYSVKTKNIETFYGSVINIGILGNAEVVTKDNSIKIEYTKELKNKILTINGNITNKTRNTLSVAVIYTVSRILNSKYHSIKGQGFYLGPNESEHFSFTFNLKDLSDSEIRDLQLRQTILRDNTYYKLESVD